MRTDTWNHQDHRMMRVLLVACLLVLPIEVSAATPSDFALRLCQEQPEVYMCIKIRIPKAAKRQYLEWAEMFPAVPLRRAAMAINRRNALLWRGHTVALPRSFDPDPLAYAPFPREKAWFGPRHVVVDLRNLAWAAYEPVPGQNLRVRLARWGPANGGAKICRETGKFACKTHPGAHRILRLHGPGKRSNLYPIDCANKRICGHKMPHYMPFHRDGTGLHGDRWLVGRNASHGCVRMLMTDARWLNKRFAFVDMPVIVEDY
jgi:hypothetical protein